MNQVDVTVQRIKVAVEENGVTTIVEAPSAAVVSTIATGPQGPAGPQGPQGPQGPGLFVNTTAKVDKSVIYYDAATEAFRADATWTTDTIVDGANF